MFFFRFDLLSSSYILPTHFINPSDGDRKNHILFIRRMGTWRILFYLSLGMRQEKSHFIHPSDGEKKNLSFCRWNPNKLPLFYCSAHFIHDMTIDKNPVFNDASLLNSSIPDVTYFKWLFCLECSSSEDCSTNGRLVEPYPLVLLSTVSSNI